MGVEIRRVGALVAFYILIGRRAQQRVNVRLTDRPKANREKSYSTNIYGLWHLF